MTKLGTIKIRPLLISIGASLAVGAAAGFLTQGSMERYEQIIKPALTPPSAVFPVVWTILYILMGISAYLVYTTKADRGLKKEALGIYAAQLAANFIWSILFFNFNAYFLSFIWLVLLWGLIIFMIITFAKINKTAALLQIPYLLWVTFAGYLNLAIYILNSRA